MTTAISTKPAANRIIDFISGQGVVAGPEEVGATQPFSRQLVEDYGNPKDHIQTRPQFGVRANPSNSGRPVPVDIAVFHGNQRTSDHLYMVVECKAPDAEPETGNDRQIYNYMKWSNAEIGVWTNGAIKEVFHKKVVNGRLTFVSIPAIPAFGQDVDDIGQHLRRDLKRPKHLQQVFRTIRAYLAGNARGTTRDEAIAVQMIHIIFCKIYDERFTPRDKIVDFRAGVNDTDQQVLERVQKIFKKVTQKYDDVFTEGDRLTLDASSIKYVVGELQSFSLSEAGRDSVGEAFEIFIGQTLKGEQGQFFTPRNVIKLMVELVQPQPSYTVIDPACGAGGFLIESLRHQWAKIEQMGAANEWSEGAITEEKTAYAIKSIRGIEKDEFLVKVAKAYMTIIGDGKGGIFCEDSLDETKNWSSRTRNEISLGAFDVVLANPPFGKDIKVRGESKLAQFRLGHKWSKGKKTNQVQRETNPQILFVERCLHLAKVGGYVGIILPETYFHSSTNSRVRQVLLRENNVVALVDLPHNTFRPFNNAKCIAAIVQKGVTQGSHIKMVVPQEMGHNHLGAPIYKYDSQTSSVTDEVWDDIEEATDALINGTTSELIFDHPAADVLEKDIWVPRYYWPGYNENVQLPNHYDSEWVSIQDLVNDGTISITSGHGSPKSHNKGKGTFTYARVKDIINWEIYRDPTASIPESIYQELVRNAPLQEGDVVYVSRGSYRIGDVAMVGPYDLQTALTREIRVFRVAKNNKRGLDPYYLLYLLSTPQAKQQTKGRVLFDTTLPNIADRYLSIKLPMASSEETRSELTSSVKDAVSLRWEAMNSIRNILAELGALVDQIALELEIEDATE